MSLRAGAQRRETLGGEFEAEEFDPAKLKLYASNVDGEVFIDHPEYEHQTVDNDMGGDTTGKGYGYRMYEPMNSYDI